ncbi:Putative zinc-finger [Anaerocolumna jejuensis DSM 15929]|uniref:Anti-sigma-W factor RsiW n=1 Tax=Anaerocolumna jejuensis DSM 15929 TaxID=1121322 RepID=A0A1M7C8U1_9FIRM|nr:DUF4825 domain-containing protein [Anaerocolumna jejuensis]SHL63655.1 Putative zinc-finger [Anaerocolumna jejuensis DSM 15929]
MEKNCDIIKDLLPLYIDGVCSEDSKKAVEEHIKTCESCRKELEDFKSAVSAVDSGEEEIIRKISYRWKKTRAKALLTGILAMLLLALAGLVFYLYSSGDRAVKYGEVTVEDLSLLPNSNVYFSLKTADDITARDADWFTQDGNVYVTLQTNRIQLHKRKLAESDFAENTDNYSHWVFDTRLGGIKNIYLFEGLNGYDDGKTEKTLIWSSNNRLEGADTRAKAWARTYHSWGNIEPGLLANTLYQHKNPYVGNMSANSKILTDLKIGRVLGNFTNELQTKKEPYGYTLLFEKNLKAEEQKDFDATMKKYALCMLALIENLSEVSWKYTVLEKGKENPVIQTITKEEAAKLLGGDIKGFGASAADIQNLLYTIGIEQ